MKPQRATLLLLLFSIALAPAFAEPARKSRGRDGAPGLERFRQMRSLGPVKVELHDPPVVETQGGSVTWYVAPPPEGSNANDGLSDTTPFQTIQFAMVQATSGDEIRVLPGSYNECINNTAFALGTQKNLSIVADDFVQNGNRGTTIIDGNGACADPFSVVNLAGSGTPGSRLEGFTIVNAVDSGVFVIGSGIVTENVISNNTGLDGGGVFAYPGTCYYGTSAINISNNTITNNTADDQGTCNPGGQTCTTDTQCGTGTCDIFGGNGGGLYVRGRAVNSGGTIGCVGGDARVTVTNNVIDGNGADYAFGGGLYVKTDAETNRLSTVSITQNLISNNTTLPFSLGYGGGAWLGTFGYGTEQIDFDDNTVTGNLTTGDGGGVSAWVDTKTQGSHTINMTNNDIVSNEAEGAGGGLDLFQISREVGGGLSKLNATDNVVDQNEALGSNPSSFSPGIGGGAVINAWSEETNNSNSGIEFSRNEVLQNSTVLAGGGIGVIVRADSDHADDGMTQPASSKVTLDNNLIALNSSVGGLGPLNATGGGVFLFVHGEGGGTGFSASGEISMNYNTVAENTADSGAGGIEIESYTILDSSETYDAATFIEIGSSIVYDNAFWGIGGPATGGTPRITVADWGTRPNTGNLTLLNDFNSLFMNGSGGNQPPLLTNGANDLDTDPLLSSALIPMQCSPTIDAGATATIPGNEPHPHGGAYNLGHTGGQPNATKTLADGTGDGFVDGADILRLSAAFATFDGDDRFDAGVDLDRDLFIGPIDLVLMAVNFAQSCP